MNEEYHYLNIKKGVPEYRDEPTMEKPKVFNTKKVDALQTNIGKGIERKITEAIEAKKIEKIQEQITKNLEDDKKGENSYKEELEKIYAKKLEWQKYQEYKEEISLELKSLLNFENSTMGKLMLFWYSITFKNKDKLKKKIEQAIKEKTDEINNAELYALEKREDWMRPQIEMHKDFIKEVTKDIESNNLPDLNSTELTDEEKGEIIKGPMKVYESIRIPDMEKIHNN